MKGLSFRKDEVKFLQSNEICRIATSHNNVPYVTPVSYIFENGKFYFATDYKTRKYANLIKNNKISLVVDTIENNKERAVVIQGITGIIHPDGRKFEDLYKTFYDKFESVRIDVWWEERKGPIIEVIPKTKTSWGV
jgi:nitroimidazol reductase NimA-like FMN-containing flavoprotein (pyridoxamine 5'-phosphate oxidase superfamily)